MLKITPCQEVTCSCSLYVAKSATIRKPILASYFSSCPVKSENCQHLCTLTTASSNNNTSTAAANKSAKGNVFCATLPCPVSYFIFIFFFQLHLHYMYIYISTSTPTGYQMPSSLISCICDVYVPRFLAIYAISKLRCAFCQLPNCVPNFEIAYILHNLEIQ